MQDKIIITKSSKEKTPNSPSDQPHYETLRYWEVDKSWLSNTARELRQLLESIHATISQRTTTTIQFLKTNWQWLRSLPLLEKTLKVLGFLLLLIKDLLLVICYLVMSIVELIAQLFVACLFFPIKADYQKSKSKPKAKTKPFEPPVDDEWWRKKSKPSAAKRKRTIRVIVEVEEFE